MAEQGKSDTGQKSNRPELKKKNSNWLELKKQVRELTGEGWDWAGPARKVRDQQHTERKKEKARDTHICWKHCSVNLPAVAASSMQPLGLTCAYVKKFQGNVI